MNNLIYKIADSLNEKEQIYNSRYRVAKNDFPFLFKQNKDMINGQDEYDRYSFLFYGKDIDVVASCRATPMKDNQWEISNSLPPNFNLNLNQKLTLQLNRVYLEKEYRNNNIHERLFCNFCEWVLKNTEFKYFFAICNAGLVRMYSKMGATLHQREGFFLKNRKEHKYYIVHGNIEETLNILKKQY